MRNRVTQPNPARPVPRVISCRLSAKDHIYEAYFVQSANGRKLSARKVARHGPNISGSRDSFLGTQRTSEASCFMGRTQDPAGCRCATQPAETAADPLFHGGMFKSRRVVLLLGRRVGSKARTAAHQYRSVTCPDEALEDLWNFHKYFAAKKAVLEKYTAMMLRLKEEEVSAIELALTKSSPSEDVLLEGIRLDYEMTRNLLQKQQIMEEEELLTLLDQR